MVAPNTQSYSQSYSEKNDIAPAAEPAIEGEETAPPVPMTVAIGASAGGHEPLEHFFTTIPSDCDLSFVVIMHLPADGPSLLPDLLRCYTSMEVLTAEDGMPLRPNTVHVIPPGKELTVSGDRLRLHLPEGEGRPSHPIDRFFTSLAADCGPRAIAVVLSGLGLDGSEGVKRIKEGGGIVLVQEPGTAINLSMPHNAIATGAADMILPAEEIAEKIAEIARRKCHFPQQVCRTTTLDEELHTLLAILKARTGHDFSAYKRSTVLRRIERRMAVNEAGGLRKYLAILEKNPQEAQALCQELLIGVTGFFRDPEAFELIRREIIPRLFADRDPDDPVRIWHACCATGEEAYSVAMLIREHLEKESLQARVQIFASDIDEAAVAVARAGLYADDIGPEVGEERLKRFFIRSNGRWQVTKQLREMIVFAHHSIIKDPPFSRLDLLVCRNFLIYLDPDMQKRLISLFHMVLKPDGVLFLGASESVGSNSDFFTAMDKKWKIFLRLENDRRKETFFPISSPVRKLARTAPCKRSTEDGEPAPGAVAERLLMERYSPPCVIVNEKYEVFHISTRTQRYMEVPVGEPTLDILRMAREELRPALRAAIYKAFTEQKQVAFRGVKMASEAAVNVLAEPLAADPAFGKLVMVILEPAPSPAVPPASSGFDAHPGDESSKEMLIRQLEEQLRITHEQLQATSDQLATSSEGFLSANEELMSINEEFQSTNEELQSTNEELETSKEELQALNEELVTVNAELQGKMEELNQSNGDLENLFTSSGIATIFLDRELIIKRFSPAMGALFNLIPADIGRPFRHLNGSIDWLDLSRDTTSVLSTLVPVEREVTAREDGRSFIMRVLPYWTTDGRIDGVVVTLVDITQRKRMEEKTARLASFPQLNPSPVLEVDSTGRVAFANPATKKTLERLGFSEADVDVFIPSDLHDILGNWDRKEDAVIHREIALQGRTFGETIFLTSQFEVARIYAFEITERKWMEDALRESEQRVRLKLESILDPEGDIGNLDLADILDAPSLQSLVDNFYELTRMPMGLIDLKGKILVGVGWQDMCTKFHRVHPETCRNCIESDLQLSAGIPHGEYKIYKCKNNMWDVATPVMVGDRQFGNLFIGQFFFEDEPLDYEFFRAQAKQYGFDEQKYIAALEAVPRLSRATLNTSMSFFMQLADLLSKLSYSNLKLARSLAERDTIMESLGESEEQFRIMFEHSSVGMAQADPATGRFLRVNAALCLLIGHPEQEMLQRTFFEMTHPEDRKADRANLDALAKGEIATFQSEKRYLRPDNTVVWVHVTVNLVHDAAGRPLRTMAVIQDITERKRAEEEREATVDFLRFINASRGQEELIHAATTFFQERSGCEAVGIRLRNGGDYPYYETRGFPEEFVLAENRLCAYDESGRPIGDSAGNPMLECMCGNVICGRVDPAQPFFTAKGSFWSNCTTELLASTTEADRQIRTRNRCNGEGYESVALIPLQLGAERLGLLQLNDRSKGRFTLENITLWERLTDYLAVALAKFRADEALKRAKEEWERTFDSVPDLITILDNQHRVLRVNEAMAQRLGVQPEECIGHRCYEVVHGASCPPGACPHSQTIADGCEHTEELHEDRLGGDFLVTTTPLLDEKGARIGSVHIAHDITERKRAEEQLQAMNEELERKVEQRTRELQETQKQYLHAEKLSAIGKLSASIAHEFNNPLQGILSILKGLKKRAILEAEDRELLDAAIGESDRIRDLIRSLQDFNRPSSHRKTFMDMHKSLDSLLLLHKSDFKGKRIAVVRDYAEELPQILAVPDQIKQVFLNLLTNAADACHLPKGMITVSTWREDDRVAVAIKDAGIGIKPEDMERIFQPFFTTKPEVKGTGLGLSVSYGIVKHHQGEIRVDSRPGEGATFTVLLPIKGGRDVVFTTDR